MNSYICITLNSWCTSIAIHEGLHEVCGGAGIVVQWVEPLIAMLASHIRVLV